MAAVTRVKARPCTPVGYEVVDKGTVTADVVAGDLLKNGASGWTKAPAGATEADGIALQDYYAGQSGCSIGIHGEMDGFSGMTPGAALYPSASAAGGLDTTAAGVIRVKAATSSRIPTTSSNGEVTTFSIVRAALAAFVHSENYHAIWLPGYPLYRLPSGR